MWTDIVLQCTILAVFLLAHASVGFGRHAKMFFEITAKDIGRVKAVFKSDARDGFPIVVSKLDGGKLQSPAHDVFGQRFTHRGGKNVVKVIGGQIGLLC